MRRIKKPVARPTDPDTSWDAARSLSTDQIRESQAKIIKVLLKAGPMTDQEIYEWVKDFMSESGARTRRKELVGYDLVCDSGKRQRTESGRRAIVWKIHSGVNDQRVVRVRRSE